MLITLATVLDFLIAMGYITFAIIVIGVFGKRLYSWAKVSAMDRRARSFVIISMLGTMMFFFGCAATHLELVYHYLTDPDVAEGVAPHILPASILQVLGVWGPIWLTVLLSREFEKVAKQKEEIDNNENER